MAHPTATGATAHMATTTLKVEGMTCGACTSAIEKGFEGVEGVGAVSISLVMERAVIQHEPNTITADQVKEIIEDRGFDAEVLSSDLPIIVEPVVDAFLSGSEEEEAEAALGVSTTTLSVGGMTCGACTSAVEGAFKDVAGIKSFSISLLSERAVIEHDTAMISAKQLAETIEDVGFDAKVLETVAHVPPKKSKRKHNKQRMLTTTVAIEGMTCGACTSAIESGFKDVDGVYQFNISLLANRTVLVHDPAKLTESQIVEIIEDRGFDAKVVTSVDGSVQSSATNGTAHLKVYGLPDAKAGEELERSLRDRPGVESATVNFSTSRAIITHQPKIIGLRALVEAIEAAGYNALVADSDDNNAQLESLAKTKEIQEWKRAFQISLCFAIPVFLTSMLFPMALKFLDYGSFRIMPGLYLGDVVCLALTAPVQFGIGKRFYVSAYKSWKHSSPTMDVLVVMGTSAAFFFSIASMMVSICMTPHTRPTTLFDTSTMLITFITLGRYLENRAKGQTSKALSRLMSLAPSMATIYADPIAAAKAAEGWSLSDDDEKDRKISMDGGSAIEEKVVATELIEVGDVVILRPGDKTPADGTVIRGESYVDESMVTGEAMPILKKKGALLMAGTVNGAGRLEFVVTRAGRDTQLSQIVRLVQEAQTSRAPIQRLADTVAGYFVPIIITLGLATFVAWIVLSHVLPHPPKIFLDHASGGKLMVCVKLCIAVIVFACPCALGLATPTAVMVGTGVGAEQGILVKGGAALEVATKVNHVVLDKTGTLTVGKMSVSKTDIQGEWANNKNLWWTLIGLAEMSSEHPIARAIVRSAKEHLRLGADGTLDGTVGDFEAAVGKGIAANVEAALARQRHRYRVLVGNASYLMSQGIVVPDVVDVPLTTSGTTPISRSTSQTRSAGITTIHTAIDKTYTGTLSLSDTIKPSARATIMALRRLGITASIVTGDTSASALAVAEQVGIDVADVHASATPQDKKAIVEHLKSQGYVVAMVGDGINDSPALASADAGIALSTGTDVAMEAASIVLMSNTDLLAIPASLVLSRAIFRRIKLNLWWACLYNLFGLPFAMGFFLPWGLSLHPMAAGLAMACSSVSVVTSSLLLKLWKRPKWMKVSVLDPTAEVPESEKEAERVPSAGIVQSAIDWVKDSLAARKRNREEVGYVPLHDMGE
ncbi:copper-transporting ATPase-like protein [Westerdykella ornata]|uniref:P-type Cu(+) transporter n=1 Tax=Westerdykella ornata TaxID=318751 RepID=A0A6A6J4R4_WESOR|nr:copper-transporting ATPase-like protein [Westerdykella ornata]KAF2271264.1 copper-transporting ATPase-like protein [Westerdykella ornata]